MLSSRGCKERAQRESKLLLKAFETDPRVRRQRKHKDLQEDVLLRECEESLNRETRGLRMYNEEPALRKKVFLQLQEWVLPEDYVRLGRKFESLLGETTDFEKDYFRVMSIFLQKGSKFNYAKDNCRLIELLFRKVALWKGFIEVCARNQLRPFLEGLVGDCSEEEVLTFFRLYREFVFPYEVMRLGKTRRLKSLEFNLFELTPCFRWDQSQEPQFYDRIFDLPISNLVNFEREIKFDGQLFNFEYLKAEYGHIRCDIRIQHPEARGFQLSERLDVQKYEMSIKDYIEYQKVYCDPVTLQSFRHKSVLGPSGNIFFGVNVDLVDMQEFLDEFTNKLPKELLFKGQHDLLSYLDSEVPGVTIPQFYLKVKGVWTGGHQENVNLTAININHGPGASEWITVDFEHVPLLRAAVLEEFGVDIHLNEGLWYIPPEFCLERGIPVRKVMQEAGDVIILGPGTLHWVRCYGVSLQSAWNFMPRNLRQLETAVFRERINREIKFGSVIIPLKSLFFTVLLAEGDILPAEMRQYLAGQVERALKQQQALAGEQRFRLKYSAAYLSFCDFCKQQIFQYYLEQQEVVMCLMCRREKEGEELGEFEGFRRLEEETVEEAVRWGRGSGPRPGCRGEGAIGRTRTARSG